jgi:hypothetical protein
MNETSATAARRAGRLLRWYPRSWRTRYGDEFTELLAMELSEQPRSWRRTADVVLSGLLARLSGAGLAGQSLEPFDQVRSSLASLGCALAVFLVFGAAMWSQLAIGWQWSQPDTPGTTAGMIVMSAAMGVFGLLGLLATAPVAWTVLRRIAARDARSLVRPSLLVVAGAALLLIGGRHFANGWPGTGGHPWALQGIVPGGLAAFAWASTLSVSSYWAHPAALAAFPTAELAWMAISPVALVCLAVGAVKIVRRLHLSPRLLRYEARLGVTAVLATIALLCGTWAWVIDGGPGPKNLFHAGFIDVAGLVMMAAASVVAFRAVTRARRLGVALLTT